MWNPRVCKIIRAPHREFYDSKRAVSQTYEYLVIRHPGQEVEDFIVGDGVRPDDFACELVDAPGHDQVAQRHQVQHHHGDADHDNRQPRQVWHCEVESAANKRLDTGVKDQ